MQKPAALLAEIIAQADEVLSRDSLNSQQITFVRHIYNTAQELHTIAAAIPPTEYAIRAIVPILGEAFFKPQSVIFGYAKMLMEQPAAFGEATLNADQYDQISSIYDKGVALAQLSEQLKHAALEERKTQRNADPIIFDLNMVIWQSIPVYRYWLRDKAVKVTAEFPPGLAPVLSNPYHVAAIAQHIVLTMATELVEYGKINISAAMRDDKQAVTLNFFCTGISLNHDEQNILFEKQGRHIYRERITELNGELYFSHKPGVGASVHLDLPLSPRITSELN
jgi:hypothetical protein